MYVRFNKSLRGDYGRAARGDVKMVTKEVGKSLIDRGLAEEAAAPDDQPADHPEPAKEVAGKAKGKPGEAEKPAPGTED